MPPSSSTAPTRSRDTQTAPSQEINNYRKKLLYAYFGTAIEYTAISLVYLISACTVYYRRHRPEQFVHSTWSTVFSAIYVLGWIITFGVACTGVVIWVLDVSATKIKGASFEAKDGARLSAVAAAILLVIGLWRIIMHAVRNDDQPKESNSGEMAERDGATRILV